jgi:hypothetical protein
MVLLPADTCVIEGNHGRSRFDPRRIQYLDGAESRYIVVARCIVMVELFDVKV